jgi:hypothetical protein
MPSYGLFQIRDLGDGNALRDAQSNLDPRKAAQNAYALYRQSGLGPWESDLPTTLSVDALYEAVRLPSRQMDSEQRAAVNQRALSIAEQVLTITTNIRPSVDTAMGVTI